MWGSGKYLLWSSLASCFVPRSQWFHDDLPIEWDRSNKENAEKTKKTTHQVPCQTNEKAISKPTAAPLLPASKSSIRSSHRRNIGCQNSEISATTSFATRMMSFVIVWQSESDYCCGIKALGLDLLVLTVEVESNQDRNQDETSRIWEFKWPWVFLNYKSYTGYTILTSCQIALVSATGYSLLISTATPGKSDIIIFEHNLSICQSFPKHQIWVALWNFVIYQY